MSLRVRRHASWAAAAVLWATPMTVPAALAQTDPAPAVPAPAKAPGEGCAKGRRVQVKPQELKKKVRGATSRTELKQLLGSLGMNIEWNGLSCSKKEEEEPPSVVLDVFKARIVSAEQQDLVVQARGRVCEEAQLLSGVVLHPLEGKDTHCAIDMPFLPGLPDTYHRKTVFGFENLIDPVRQVFKVDSQREDSRNTYFELSYWEAQDGELRHIFSISTGEHMGFMNGVSTAKVTAQGAGFPRQLLIKESSRTCGNFVDMPSGESVYTSDCTEVLNEQLQCYQRDPKTGRAGYAECQRSPY
ncbi:MAG TPA: hypothetical protein VFZ09_46200 [Archangium sp.]|uniref:hypothetical protein n=1 Tax=Archangium sp. TaxID=1872627 RepID=UPI002E2EA472|nr:hypothetical protein [Archangium sp.]HEX5753670.1 hypothetical protein [Archangium sp.]